MRKFIKKTIIFCLLFVVSAICLFVFDYFVIGNQHLGSYQASLIDKVERLKSIDEPQIVLLGNSNVCFGVDSKQIEEKIGMPVVDMGLHGGLGNAFHENMIKLGVSEGDIVILCHGDYSDDDDISDTSLAWITIEMHKELWPLIRVKDMIPMARSYPNYVLRSFVYLLSGEEENKTKDGTCYTRSNFNEYGDIIKRFDDRYEFYEGSVMVPEISDKCVNRINVLNDYIEKKGATLLVAGYPIGYGEYTPSEEEYDIFEEKLRDKLDCEVISHYTDYFIPYELFYNTNMHLLDEGVEIRTKQLIADIQNWMNKE